MALGDNIKKLREEHLLTQQQLADKLYVSRQTVCRWENGSRCPDLIMAKRLAVELDISLDELISDEDLKEFTKNDFPFHSDVVKRRKELEKKQKYFCWFQFSAGYSWKYGFRSGVSYLHCVRKPRRLWLDTAYPDSWISYIDCCSVICLCTEWR